MEGEQTIARCAGFADYVSVEREARDDIHEVFMTLAIGCWRCLTFLLGPLSGLPLTARCDPPARPGRRG